MAWKKFGPVQRRKGLQVCMFLILVSWTGLKGSPMAASGLRMAISF
jgi:hypothetical protein